MSAPTGVSTLGGVCSGGSAPGGCLLWGGSALGGICSGGCLLPGDVCSVGVWGVSAPGCTPPREQNSSFAAGKNVCRLWASSISLIFQWVRL